MSSPNIASLCPGFAWGAYPEREDRGSGWLEEAGERFADAFLRRVTLRRKRLEQFAQRVEQLGDRMADLSTTGVWDEALAAGAELRRCGFSDEPVARAFALVREVARRELEIAHFPSQLMGGRVMLAGAIAEMETGEGKTLAATLPACAAALAGIPVHVITVNDYLVERDAEEMGPIYRALGLRVGEVRHGMDPGERQRAYSADVTYVSNKEIAFDYLRDRITLGAQRSRVRLLLERASRGRSRADGLLLRGLCFGIVDEADSVLVDEARTPLVISGGTRHEDLEVQVCRTALELAAQLVASVDFVIDARERSARLTHDGEMRLAALSEDRGGVFRGPNRRAELVSRALSALHLFERDRHYLVRDDKIQIIDEHTGRLMSDRSWQRGMHQLIEVKEGVPISSQTEPLAKISYQRLFRRYLHLAGMTGTAQEITRELWAVYGLPVVRIPTHRPLQRKSLGIQVHLDVGAKWDAIIERIQLVHAARRPVLVGTRSVVASEHLSGLLRERGLVHRVLNARQDRAEAEIVERAGVAGAITVATNMAGRGTDIRLDSEARAAGGLHVIATELHESRRIDRQLFGRCGRQGDPGTYECVVALDDDLVRDHGALTQRLAPREDGGQALDEQALDDGVNGQWRLMVVRLAQRRAERLHAAMRRQVLKQDDRVSALLAFSGRGE